MDDRVVTSVPPSLVLGRATSTRKRARERDATSSLDRPAAPLQRIRRLDSAQLPTLVDIGQVADHLGVSIRHVRRLVAERRIPYVKWGNLLRFNPREISNWLADRTVDPLAHGRRGRRGR